MSYCCFVACKIHTFKTIQNEINYYTKFNSIKMKELIYIYFLGNNTLPRLMAWFLLFALVLSLQVQAATITVTNGNDTGAGSLCQAIANAIGGDVIVLSGVTTVALTSEELDVNKSLTIDGGTAVAEKTASLSANIRNNVTNSSAYNLIGTEGRGYSG